ncbi:MAG: SUMF1/EgtB/PvdO family nonheme iron enzyme [Anaerolineae bacterium]|nr:SUMF1/EgtB/PvdO family nonheme iron enzyme [Anaerolineae bacterium]
MTLAKEQVEFQKAINGDITPFVDLPVVSQLQELPLNGLTWENFEILCCRLVIEEPNIQGTPYRYGIQGNTQLGIDIVSNIQNGDKQERWCYQCKRYKEFNISHLKSAISSLEYDAVHYVICISTRATAEMRDEVENHPTKSIEIWDAQDISTKLKPKGNIVEDFFGEEWKKRFCVVGGIKSATGRIAGRVFDHLGHPVYEADIKVVLNGVTHNSAKSNLDGTFHIDVFAQNSILGIIAEKMTGTEKLRVAKQIGWQEVTQTELHLIVREEKVITGRIVECGTDNNIDDATVLVTFLDEIIAYQKSSDGSFRFGVPAQDSSETYNLKLTSLGFIESNVELDSSQRSFSFGLVRHCIQPTLEKILTITICDGLRLELMFIEQGEYYKGDPQSPTKVYLPSYYISRFPITCIQYSFYAQHEKITQLPLGWKNYHPPENTGKLPISGISWLEAKAFTNWLCAMANCGFDLPNEEEWEKAARGREDIRPFPWGDDATNLIERCNSVDNGIGRVMPCDFFPAGRSPFGVWDMSGNVWEWTSTEASSGRYYLKGGSYNEQYEELQCHSRIDAKHENKRPFYGFRVAMKGVE